MSVKPHKIHVFPLDVKKPNGRWTTSHCTDKTGMCGCKPELKQTCPEWEEEYGRTCKPNCWRCGGSGLVEPFNPKWSTLIIHNEEKQPVYPEYPDSKLGAK